MKCQDRWIAFSSFKVADVLLGHASSLRGLFLRQSARSTQPAKVQTDLEPYVHGGLVAESALVLYLL